MEQAGVAISITAVVMETGRLVMEISKMAKTMMDHRARGRCEKLQVELDKLTRLLNGMRGPINESVGIVKEAEDCGKKIEEYVTHMANTGIVSDAVEIWWRGRYDGILAEARRVNQDLTVGLLARTDFNPLDHLGPGGKARAVQTMFLSHRSITFNDTRSMGRGTIAQHGAVVCHRLESSPISLESLAMYPRLQERSYVQQLRGIAELNNQLYIVMQDCSSHKTLNELLCDKRGWPCDMAAKVEIAFCIAKTFAWYHRSDMILKSASDEYIYMEERTCETTVTESAEKTYTPILTGLEHMRNLYEGSTGLRLDCRYEAPEYDYNVTHHTRYTDMWCLGILVWQVICEDFPYGLKKHVDSDNGTAIEKIRTYLMENREPGVFPPDILHQLSPEVVDGLKACWRRDPMHRPTPMAVADMLLDARSRILLTRNELLPKARQVVPYCPPGDNLEGAKREVQTLVNQQREAVRKQKEKNRKEAKEKKQREQKDNEEPKHEKQTEFRMDSRAISSVLPLPPQGRIAPSLVEMLLRGINPECACLIGASIWWNLVDDNTLGLVAGFRAFEYLTTTTDGQRAELALSFLQQAVRGGCVDGYLEMHEAHALLSKQYKDKHKKALQETRTSSCGLGD
ncbi:kinase-like domain-containing protein [Diaporthe sp. PMI_573]|nr:kinase-like domain-containing protein [Diaporthaceae sp. PMI_573]